MVLGLTQPFHCTGAKLAVVDATGKNADNQTIVLLNQHQLVKSKKPRKIADLIGQYSVEIAIGNGTASRESEAFVAEF